MQWAPMKLPPSLRLEPRRSRTACAAIVVACSATSILLFLLPLPGAVTAAGAAADIVVLVSGLWRCAGRGVPALLHVGIDRRITVVDRAGRSRTGPIMDDSYVGAVVTTIVWRADGDPWWRPARAILILPGTLPRDEFRRLRVALRYGRVVGAAETSAIEAG
jgi:hypothetical protein